MKVHTKEKTVKVAEFERVFFKIHFDLFGITLPINNVADLGNSSGLFGLVK